MKLLRIAALLMCVMILFTCTMCLYAETVEDDDEGDEIAYVPAETVEYEGYQLGATGIVALVLLAAATIVITYILTRRSINSGAYNIA